jgi:hypothetical protein
LWDLERLDAVEMIRRARKKVGDEIELMRSRGREFKGTRYWQSALRALAWFRYGTFECASMYLKGRDARASANTIRASYRRCIRRADLGKGLDRYYLFDEDFLVKLGFPRMSERKPGTEYVSLYDLAP